MRVRFHSIAACIGIGLLCAGRSGRAADDLAWMGTTPAVEDRKPFAAVVLQDQYGKEHRYEFPATRPMVLLVADKKGYGALAPWIEAVREQVGRQALIVGVADVRGVPGFLHRRVQRRFQSGLKHPVLLDWDGVVLDPLDPEKGVPNAYLITATGTVVLHLRGEATAENLERLQRRLRALSAAKPQGTIPLPPPQGAD